MTETMTEKDGARLLTEATVPELVEELETRMAKIRATTLSDEEWWYEAVMLVAAHYRVSLKQLQGRDKHQPLALARQVAMWILRTVYDRTLENVGEVFRRDYGTVIHAVKVVNNYANVSVEFRRNLQNLCDRLERSRRMNLRPHFAAGYSAPEEESGVNTAQKAKNASESK